MRLFLFLQSTTVLATASLLLLLFRVSNTINDFKTHICHRPFRLSISQLLQSHQKEMFSSTATRAASPRFATTVGKLYSHRAHLQIGRVASGQPYTSFTTIGWPRQTGLRQIGTIELPKPRFSGAPQADGAATLAKARRILLDGTKVSPYHLCQGIRASYDRLSDNEKELFFGLGSRLRLELFKEDFKGSEQFGPTSESKKFILAIKTCLDPELLIEIEFDGNRCHGKPRGKRPDFHVKLIGKDIFLMVAEVKSKFTNPNKTDEVLHAGGKEQIEKFGKDYFSNLPAGLPVPIATFVGSVAKFGAMVRANIHITDALVTFPEEEGFCICENRGLTAYAALCMALLIEKNADAALCMALLIEQNTRQL
jgi:hypothetical protein